MSDETYHLAAAQIAAMEGTHKVHFLNDQAVRTNKSLGDMTGLKAIGVHMVEVEPGRLSTELHVHHHEEEAVYILSGTGTAVIGEEERPVGPGDFIGYRAGGLAHTIRATGDAPLRMLVVGQRLAQDVADYPKLGKRLFRQQGTGWNMVDHADIVVPGGSAGKK
ncbi:cupin domain-containing protein [Rhodovulum sp. DZ06]|uniref:cupin domain-containing protein n=1 Tax=Rhodovulum sp. DZ06 TaxID=3425126 RepID=UPI003D3332FA